MIRDLHLQNFKCFEDQSFVFGNLTLLSGLNGMGKSSVLQALLLLRQSYQQSTLPTSGLSLNGDLACLGTGRDVLFEGAAEETIGFEIAYDTTKKAHLQFESVSDADLLRTTTNSAKSDFYRSSLFTNDFHYLQAERIGPRTSFAMSDYFVVKQQQIGIRGEYAYHFLATYGFEDVSIAALRREEARSSNLLHQTEAWIGIVSPGLQIHLEAHRKMDIVHLEYSFNMGKQNSNNYRAINVGFGITYTLPVLVAILSSKPGSLILLENPEAHLHPRGQAYIGELLALAANSGVQIILETHSDHVLNGIRVAVHNKHIAAEKVRLYYFGRKEQEGQVVQNIVSPQIDRDGRIDNWPDGFFDEMDRSLGILLEPTGE